MTKLTMTRPECAKIISRVADDLRYHCDRACDIAKQEQRDTEMELFNEIQIRQSIQTLVQLLQVMDDLT